MKFLKKLTVDEEEKTDEKNAIRIKKIYELTVQCDNCSYWGKMKGGPLFENTQRAVFECPDCSEIKFIKWDFGI